MNSLPNDVIQSLTDRLRLVDVYSLKRVNSSLFEAVTLCQKLTTCHFDTFWGVSVKNICLLGRDYSLEYQPLVLGLMNVKTFKKFRHYFSPTSFGVDCGTSTLNLIRFLLKNNLGLNLVISVCQKNLMTITRTNVAICAQRLELISRDKITIEVSMQLLKLHKQHIRSLVIRGEVNDMQFVFSMLPRGLEHLEVYSSHGVHDVRSLPLFFHLGLRYLNLYQCYEVCRHPECVNYNSISSQIRKCNAFPDKIAMSPFPLDAIKWCEAHHVTIDFESSNYFDFEFEEVMDHIQIE